MKCNLGQRMTMRVRAMGHEMLMHIPEAEPGGKQLNSPGSYPNIKNKYARATSEAWLTVIQPILPRIEGIFRRTFRPGIPASDRSGGRSKLRNDGNDGDGSGDNERKYATPEISFHLQLMKLVQKMDMGFKPHWEQADWHQGMSTDPIHLITLTEMPDMPVRDFLVMIATDYAHGRSIRKFKTTEEVKKFSELARPMITAHWLAKGGFNKDDKLRLIEDCQKEKTFEFYDPGPYEIDCLIDEFVKEHNIHGSEIEWEMSDPPPSPDKGHDASETSGNGTGGNEGKGESPHWNMGKIWPLSK